MSRLPHLTPEMLNDEQRQVYSTIVESRGGARFGSMHPDGSLDGPFNAMVLAPVVGGALQELGAALRYRTQLSDRAREVAILMVAAHWESGYERHAHERVARAAGVTEDELAAVRAGRALPATDPVEAATWSVVAALLERNDLDEEAWTAALDALGPERLVELTTLVGYYATLALQLRVFRVAAPSSSSAVLDVQ